MRTATDKKRASKYDEEHVVNANDVAGQDLLALKNGEAFLLHVNTGIMNHVGIEEGDFIVVNRKREAMDQQIVIAEVDGDLVIRKLESNNGRQKLVAPASVSSIDVNGRLKIVGVVTYVIKRMVSGEL